MDMSQSCLQGLYSEPLAQVKLPVLGWRRIRKGPVRAWKNIKSPFSDMLSLSCLLRSKLKMLNSRLE